MLDVGFEAKLLELFSPPPRGVLSRAAATVGGQRAANMSRAVQYEEDAFCFLLPRIRAMCKAGQTFCSPAASCLYVHY